MLVAGPISAIAARKAKQRLAEVEQSPVTVSPSPVYEEPPLKKARASASPKRAESAIERKKASRQVVEVTAESISTKSSRRARTPPPEPSPVQAADDAEDAEDVSISDDGSGANSGAENRYIWPEIKTPELALTGDAAPSLKPYCRKTGRTSRSRDLGWAKEMLCMIP